jgi:hypothetical protein
MSRSILPRVSRVALSAVVAGVLSSGAWAAEGSAAEPSGEAQSAVWTHKELTFIYQGFTTKYSCDGLQDKMRGVLLDLGARKKTLKVMQMGCSSPAGRPDPFPGVRVKMDVLEPATGSAGSNGSAEDQKPVAAHWKPVDLKLRNSLTTDSGECELVEQIRQKIVPQFAARNVELQTNCIPHQASATRPSLKLEVLAPDAAQHPAKEPQGAQ